jgi:2-iminobutanoate/2-iminopropanoate deaminase
MRRVAINIPDAPAVGPYSHAVVSGELLFLSGQTATDAVDGALPTGTVTEQTRQCLKNLFAVLAAASAGPGHVVETRVFLTDMDDFKEMNAAYAEHFTPPYPARTTIGVASLPLGARVEISLVARMPAT